MGTMTLTTSPRRLPSAVAATRTGDVMGDTARARALRRWYGSYHAELDGHHPLEDDLWFPILAERVPTFAEDTDRIELEHHLMDDALRCVELPFDRFVDSDASSGAKAGAHDAAYELSSLLNVYLGFEDADILPQYLRRFTPEEYAEVEAQARRLLEVRRLPSTVPWILTAATPAKRTHILGSGPLALKLLWYAGRRNARLSTRALGPTTQGVA